MKNPAQEQPEGLNSWLIQRAIVQKGISLYDNVESSFEYFNRKITPAGLIFCRTFCTIIINQLQATSKTEHGRISHSRKYGFYPISAYWKNNAVIS